MSNNLAPCHIVQIGSDDSAFSLGLDAEYVQRQVTYGKLLEELRPNSVMTLIILTKNKDAKLFRIDNVTFRPLIVQLKGWSKFKAWYHLYSTLEELDSQQYIDVLATQTVHDEAWMALLFAKRNQRTVIGQIHYDIFSPYAKTLLAYNLQSYLRRIVIFATMKYFTELRVVGESIAKEILKRNLHKSVHVIPVPMAMLSKDPSLKNKTRENKVLFVGRLAEEKNLITWLQVAELVLQKIPETSFEIVGEGKLRKDLEDFVMYRGIGSKIHFLGFVNYEKLTEIYQSTSVFLITSLYEGFGRVAAEALANQVPVVAPQITGIEDIVVHGQSGYLHIPFDVSSMAESVATLLRNPSVANEMGKWGEKYVKQKFDPQILTRNWIQLLVDHT